MFWGSKKKDLEDLLANNPVPEDWNKEQILEHYAKKFKALCQKAAEFDQESVELKKTLQEQEKTLQEQERELREVKQQNENLMRQYAQMKQEVDNALNKP